MKSNLRTDLFFWLIVCVFNIALSILFILNICTGFKGKQEVLFCVFSVAFFLIATLLEICLNKKLFEKFYKKASRIVSKSQPEFFADSHYVVSKTLAYKKTKISIVILLSFSIICQLIIFIL